MPAALTATAARSTILALKGERPKRHFLLEKPPCRDEACLVSLRTETRQAVSLQPGIILRDATKASTKFRSDYRGVKCRGRVPVRKMKRNAHWNIGRLWLLALLWAGPALIHAQTCESAADLDSQVRATLENTARKYFDMAAKGDAAGLQQNSIPAVASNFSGIEVAVKDNQPAFAQAQGSVRSAYLLTAEGKEPLARAEFLCGVFGSTGQTSGSSVFVLNNLPPGKYGVVILDAKGSTDAHTLTLILQEVGSDWKLGGFFARPAQLNGHDSNWFAQRAREFKSKGQNRNAWFYFREAIALQAPADFVSTLATDRLYDEAQSVQPTDLPISSNTVDLAVGTTTYKLTSSFPLAVGKEFDLVVRYQAADVSNTLQTFQANMAVIKALVAKYPEFRDAFDGVVARAVEPSGRDYGAMLPMKEIK